MNDYRDRRENEDPLAAEAVEWFLRVEHDDAPLEVVAAWQQWLGQSEAHREAYRQTQRTWQALDRLAPAFPLTDADVGRTLHSKRIAAGRSRRRLLSAAACLAGVAVAGTTVLRLTSSDVVTYHTRVSTDIARHREIDLPDASHVLVGARSIVEIEFTRGQRQVRLISGEAFFSVAKDAQRPFVVDAGPGRVTAVGTAFNVHRYGDSVAVEVAEGQVRLEAVATRAAASQKVQPTTTTSLRRGQEAIMDGSGALQQIRHRPAESVAAWRKWQHHYIDEPLSIVIADLNRYATQQIVVSDPAVETLRITTTFFNDDWRGWLRTLEAAVPALEIEEDQGIVHISARQP